MRRVLPLSLFAALFAAAASATPLTLGVHGGSCLPNLRDNGGNEISTGWSSRVAPAFGASADLPLVSGWSMLVEVNFTGQGGKRDGFQPINDSAALGAPAGTYFYANFKQTAKLYYVEIPVLARYHFMGPLRPTASAGPYVGFLTSAKTVTSGISDVWADRDQVVTLQSGVDFGATTDGKADLKAFNWGMQAGVGASLPYGPGAITLDLRAGLGLSDIQKSSLNGKNTTGALVVALGYAMSAGH